MGSDIIYTIWFESVSDRKQYYPYPIHIRATIFRFYPNPNPNPIKPYFSGLIKFGYDAYPSGRVNFTIPTYK